MSQYLIVFGFFFVGFLAMGLILQFSQFKKRGSCCGDILEEQETDSDKCFACPNRENEEILSAK